MGKLRGSALSSNCRIYTCSKGVKSTFKCAFCCLSGATRIPMECMSFMNAMIIEQDETIINFKFDASLFRNVERKSERTTTTIVRYYVIENLLNKYLSGKYRGGLLLFLLFACIEEC